MTLKLPIKIIDGKCETYLVDYFRYFKNGSYVLDVYDPESKTIQQMRLYRGPLISILMDYSGYSHDECNNIFKHKFLDVEVIHIEGVEYKVLPSLEKITKVKFARFIRNVTEYLETLGLNPPTL